MKVSLEWLSDFIILSLSDKALVDAITMAGIEVEGVYQQGANFDQVVVAEILTSEKHPSADRLSVCRVSTGQETYQIVCGAKNYKIGDKVPLALPGAVLPGDFKIKESKLRGELSQGMMCSGKELGLSDSSEGLLILDTDTQLGIPIKELFPSNTVLDLEITPNRPDLLSYYGLARELVTLGLAQWKSNFPVPFQTKIFSLNLPTLDFEISISEDCFAYSLTSIEGVSIHSSNERIKRRLESVGLRAINSVVDVTNYILLEWGHPMHAFDRDKLSLEKGLQVRKAKKGEALLALDHRNYELNEQDLVIADDKGPIAIAGVIGGEKSAVTQETRNILLEVACFSPQRVRATSRRLNLSTDSSYRFERGVDSKSLFYANYLALENIQKLGGKGKAQTLIGKTQSDDKKIALRFSRLDNVLGVVLERDKVKKSLTLLGCSLVEETVECSQWLRPSWRPDLEREIDLIEEISRVIGLETIPSRFQFRPAFSSQTDKIYDSVFQLKQKLIGLGFFEVVTSPLSSSDKDKVEILNPLTSDQTRLRSSLKKHLLRVASENWSHGNKQLRLFELGKVFSSEKENWNLGIVLSGFRSAAHWDMASEMLNYYDLKGLLEILQLSASRVESIAPRELKEWGIKQPVFYAEVSQLEAKVSSNTFKPWPIYPSVTRDVALLVEKQISAETIQQTFLQFKNSLLKEVSLFDLFMDESGKKMPAHLKSMAYSVRYQSPDRTLTDTEVNALHDSLKNHLKENLKCDFR